MVAMVAFLETLPCRLVCLFVAEGFFVWEPNGRLVCSQSAVVRFLAAARIPATVWLGVLCALHSLMASLESV